MKSRFILNLKQLKKVKQTIKILIDVDSNYSEEELHCIVFEELLGISKVDNARKLGVNEVEHRIVEVYPTN